MEGEGKGGEAEHKPKAKGRAQLKPKSGQTEQAPEGETSGTSESNSQDKEDEKDKSANVKRMTEQQAQRRKAYALDQVPQVVHKGHNVPFAHRLCRKSPNELRKRVTIMVDKWKNKYYNIQGLSNLVDPYLLQGPDL